AVGGDADQLRVAAIGVERAEQVVGELYATGEQPPEGDFLRGRAVVEEQVDRAARRQAAAVSHARVNAPARRVAPAAQIELADAPGLARREDREENLLLGQGFERRRVDGALGQPH